MAEHEDRIALFLDYENLAIGARDRLGVDFDLAPIADAMAERGRTIVRRAYADWSMFDEDRRMLTRQHVELIEITQRMGKARKNSADIKLAVDAIELAFERDYITTFVIGTGDSDFTPLVHKLRELDKRVIGFGIEGSTSNILPPACDEFLFYDRLVDLRRKPKRNSRASGRAESDRAPTSKPTEDIEDDDTTPPKSQDMTAMVVSTLTGLMRGGDSSVRSSTLKRSILRKDPTFDESDHGHRGFGELLRALADDGVIELEGTGDVQVALPSSGGQDETAMALLESIVQKAKGPTPMSGLKRQMRDEEPDFNEKRLGYSGFLTFCKAAASRGLIELGWDDAAEDYLVSIPTAPTRTTKRAPAKKAPTKRASSRSK